jgi:F-type H+-transporting ATPase subunit delta
MNAGIIASRYAKALLKFVRETGNGRNVYSQACRLVSCMEEVVQFREYLENQNEIGLDRKIELAEAALGGPLSMEMRRFIALVCERRRMNCFLRILYVFVEEYRKENGIKVGKLTVAIPAEDLKERMEKAVQEKEGGVVQVEMAVDPKIIGGFIFEMDGKRMDASVEGRIARIRRHLVEKNNRIV